MGLASIRSYFLLTATWLALLCVIALGLFIRAGTWDATTSIRFNGDIDNGFNWGKRAHATGYFNLYESIGPPVTGQYNFDYAPLRLGVMTSWVAWLDKHEMGLEKRDPSRAYHAPLLVFNLMMEILTCALAGAVVWKVRKTAYPGAPAFAYAACAASIGWLNPALILEAQAWPQWDVWAMPFFVGALWLGLSRRWLFAGVVLGVGAMFKGQLMAVTWALVLWPLFMRDWRGALQMMMGVVTGVLVVGSPWALSVYVADASARRIILPGVILTGVLVCASILLPRRWRAWKICLAISIGLTISMTFFGGTDYWLARAFGVGTSNFPYTHLGPASNVPAVLNTRYDISDIKRRLFTLPSVALMNSNSNVLAQLGGAVSLRTGLLSVFVVMSLICVARAAAFTRTRDVRVLVALSLPWLFFALFPAQIHERYLLFVSISACMWIGAGIAPALLGMLLTTVATCQIVQSMISSNGITAVGMSDATQSPWGFVLKLAAGTHPGIAWAVLLCAVVLVYGLFSPRHKETICSTSVTQ